MSEMSGCPFLGHPNIAFYQLLLFRVQKVQCIVKGDLPLPDRSPYTYYSSIERTSYNRELYYAKYKYRINVFKNQLCKTADFLLNGLLLHAYLVTPDHTHMIFLSLHSYTPTLCFTSAITYIFH